MRIRDIRRNGLPVNAPVAIGLAFTSWRLDSYAILTLQIRRPFSSRAIVLSMLLYAAFVTYVVAAG
jgi:hypothetical protein